MPPNSSNSSNDRDEEEPGFLESLGLPPPGELLPLGYVYLLLLGIASESIHFALLGVNIIDYSNVLDVLLSPIALVTGDIEVLAVVIGVPLVLWPYLKFMRYLARKKPTEKNKGLREQPIGKVWLPMCMLALFCAFLGLGLGQGFAQSRDLAAGEMDPDTRITFGDGEIVEAYLVGINSGYVFFVERGANDVTIAPIPETIRSLQALPDDD
ncbi:hypothetical protein HFP89_15485 [Wenzhouxiangella sp. XN79A]|uniref:hypothetical protein n=1 Tax=Wenzhouxiangella sp. XN79A TaxID=2724193 RepID=UPI00144AE072|nr:hypothetical protein [Wenzhouxiangella sp. XN79A]NKI36573.1 hypothetical protein [Wenzhouxiangella sp. XN79A]